MQKVPAQKLKGTLAGVFAARGGDFVSREVEELSLTFDGIEDDYHAGTTRLSGGREPWYKRGTEMRNERQISMLSVEEMNKVAQALNIEKTDVGAIGGNFLIEGVPNFSKLPPRTQMFFPSGAVVRIDGYNAPCKISGKSLQDQNPGRDDIELGFVKAARRTRGLVGWVEKPGVVKAGDEITFRIWPQELYVVES